MKSKKSGPREETRKNEADDAGGVRPYRFGSYQDAFLEGRYKIDFNC